MSIFVTNHSFVTLVSILSISIAISTLILSLHAETTNQTVDDTCEADQCNVEPTSIPLTTSPKPHELLPLFSDFIFTNNGSKFINNTLFNEFNLNDDECEYLRRRINITANQRQSPSNYSLIGCSYYNYTEPYPNKLKGIIISISYYDLIQQNLDFRGNLDFKYLTSISKLKNFQLYASTAFTIDNLDGVSNIPTLESLTIYYATINNINFNDISKSNIVELALIQCDLTGTIDFGQLVNSKSLKYLTLRYNTITGVKFNEITDEKSNLTVVALSNNDIKGEFSLKPFIRSNAKYINLAGNKINKINLGELLTESKLHTLVVSNNSLEGIFEMRSLVAPLKVLEVEYNQIREIKFAETMAMLQIIKLSGNPLIESDRFMVEFFTKLIKMNPNLVEIYFKNCGRDRSVILIRDLELKMMEIKENIPLRKKVNTTIYVNDGKCIFVTDGTVECV